LQPFTAPTTTATTTSTSSTTSTTLVSGCFTDTGDGTIHDTCTGLQWEKKTTTAGLQNVTNLYSWAGCCNGCFQFLFPVDLCQPNAAAAATCAAQADGGTQGCSVCASGTCDVGEGALTTVWDWVNQVNAANFAGHSDWRLPSEGGTNSPSTGARELETILLAPYPCGTSPCITTIFGPTASSYYWSASTSTYASNPALASGVDFNNGILLIGPKASALYVRAVRGGSAPSCTDRVKDGSETDVDCGGSCPPCGDFKTCNSPSDCESGHCQTPTPSVCKIPAVICIPAHCFDGVQDFNESDVDCGDFCATGCATGKMCDQDNCDCASGVCNGGVCQ